MEQIVDLAASGITPYSTCLSSVGYRQQSQVATLLVAIERAAAAMDSGTS
ncbi:MAG: hypothetical protein ABI047_01820 [Jatrophihabitantaceae bacterium]